MTQRGLFITLEGGEGSGKTTQIRRLADALQKTGRTVITTREPGGTPEAEKIRNLLVHRDGGAWTPVTECLLLFAARAMHVETLIKPALAEGKIVISDRFTDSTRAYQAYGHGVDLAVINQLEQLSIGGFGPDLTFVLDIAPDVGLARAGKRLASAQSGEDRFERLGIAFHQRLREGYLAIAAAAPGRCRVIDAARDPDAIAVNLQRIALERLAGDAV